MNEFKEDCRNKGIGKNTLSIDSLFLVTEAAEVERLVKGDHANMSAYGVKEKPPEEEKPQFEAQTPPGPPPQQNIPAPVPETTPVKKEYKPVGLLHPIETILESDPPESLYFLFPYNLFQLESVKNSSFACS